MGNEALSNIIKTTYFTPENAIFRDSGGFLSLHILPGEDREEKEYDILRQKVDALLERPKEQEQQRQRSNDLE